MPDDTESEANLLRLIEAQSGKSSDSIGDEDSLIGDIGFTRQTLREFAFILNKDDYFRALGVALVPDDVADCETVFELIQLVESELTNEVAPRRKPRR